jgi:hypothetical protein
VVEIQPTNRGTIQSIQVGTHSTKPFPSRQPDNHSATSSRTMDQEALQTYPAVIASGQLVPYTCNKSTCTPLFNQSKTTTITRKSRSRPSGRKESPVEIGGVKNLPLPPYLYESTIIVLHHPPLSLFLSSYLLTSGSGCILRETYIL